MSNKILRPFNKVMGVLGLSEEEDFEIEEQEEELDIEPVHNNRNNNKVVSIKTSFPKVLLKKPQDLEDTIDIIEAIKAKRIAILNMVSLEHALAQRMLDIIVGACYALNGDIQEIAKSVYLVVPDAVEITNELREHLDKNAFISL
ncbi:Cell division protein SepF [Caloramator mitchellensis]|uniref:Cell division protein SepF n=1 Tax=Caloramator mitchellensis TaxID=908809 RepID=A0A0R3JSS1_CALMK|nr:cell division protein SepF [Caloramator mitchellensis]KRQ86561.1 Cell division protein SepF [Caloramator mitchellensis]